MTPADDATFIDLWHAGLETAEIARRLGIKATTAQSRAHRLQQRGLIPPRPRGGAYPSQRRQAAAIPVQRPVQNDHTAPVQGSVEPTPVQITALPPYPNGKAIRWNLWILDAIREEIATVAAQRGLSPSQLVQEILWQALSDRGSATR